MAKAIVLEARPRDGVGTSAARRLRAQGLLPGVIYGAGMDPRPLAVSRAELIRVLHAHGSHALVTLRLDGQEYLALVQEVQVDPVRREALHVDFHKVEADRPVHTEVPVHLVGESPGVRAGGILELILRTVSIEALPHRLPEAIDFDVSGLELGAVARVGDLTPPEGVTILTDPEEVLATVITPRVAAAAAAEEAAPVAEEAAAAPEAPEGEEG